MSTECPDMSSYKAATEVWWRSEDAIPIIYNMPSEKKKSPPKSEEEKFGRQMSVAKLNNFCNTFDKEELCENSALAAKTQVLLQIKMKMKLYIQIRIFRTKQFGSIGGDKAG